WSGSLQSPSLASLIVLSQALNAAVDPAPPLFSQPQTVGVTDLTELPCENNHAGHESNMASDTAAQKPRTQNAQAQATDTLAARPLRKL
ncbi:MAG: hypothetical protein WD029_04125, partial [Microthrixaceae bacterium]